MSTVSKKAEVFFGVGRSIGTQSLRCAWKLTLPNSSLVGSQLATVSPQEYTKTALALDN